MHQPARSAADFSARPAGIPGQSSSTGRRGFLRRSADGLHAAALMYLFGRDFYGGRSVAASEKADLPRSRRQYDLLPKQTHFPAKAKSVIHLCMQGGPSQVDLFDPKPELTRRHGQSVFKEIAADLSSPEAAGGLMGSPFKFAQHGQSGAWVSELMPHVAREVDQLAIIRSMYTTHQNHEPALYVIQSGQQLPGLPSLGSWVVYGMGSENRNLPGFVSIKPPVILGGARNYASAFLPAHCQGTPIGTMSRSMKEARVANLENANLSAAGQREQLELVNRLNRLTLARREQDEALEGLIHAGELAFSMQQDLPALMDFSQESKSTLEMYGIGADSSRTDDFGRQCLLARRLAENGVRFIELTHDNWDHHGGVAKNMPLRCSQVDQPIAALLQDLSQRGLLDDTLVLWGGEFGRTPDDPRGDGRGHNKDGFTMWLAGGGVRGGMNWGATDEYGYEAVEGRVHVHDLHATILHLMGLDHTRLTFRYGGRDFRLTDVFGNVVRPIIA